MSYRKLGRNSAARKALFTSILTSFFRYGRIETTEAKAKELRKFAENLITLAKRGDLSARRQAIAQLADEDVVRKLFDEIASKYADRVLQYIEDHPDFIQPVSRRNEMINFINLEMDCIVNLSSVFPVSN